MSNSGGKNPNEDLNAVKAWKKNLKRRCTNESKSIKERIQSGVQIKKTKSYRYSLIGAIAASIGLLIVLGTLVLDFGMHMFSYPQQIVGYAIGAVIAAIGMVLDGIGETIFSKEFKEYLKSKQ